MRELVQADQRTTPHRSALDYLFSFGCAVAFAWLGERSEPTCIKTSTRHGANRLTFSEKYGIINSPINKNMLDSTLIANCVKIY